MLPWSSWKSQDRDDTLDNQDKLNTDAVGISSNL
jgi:hypothetical protein